jgi:hypothetical protein
VKEDLLRQIQEWRREQERIEDMIEDAYQQIDELEN